MTTVLATLTIIAIFAGPIVAVRITRYLDDRRLKQDRRMDVFRTLMRTRRVKLSPDHVGALNLVEIEFQHDASVISAWKAYFQNLGERWPHDLKPEELQELQEKRSTLLTRLLHEMANALNFEIEQLDIFRGGYAPQGWQDAEDVQRLLQYHLLQVLTGNRPFPVTPVVQPQPNGTPSSPFPPPP